ncbi:MAG: hypothetical protein JW850_14630, partial [Thermoflexales bacterium]|nr:hypothetical protein [Thermoflexales bacterium]
GTDGMRGRVGDFPLVPDFALRLGLATGTVLRESCARPSVIIGRDTRHSGQMLQNALTAGLLAGGATAIDAGVITTPGVAYLVRKLNAQTGVVISASHNPVDENGIKYFSAEGFKLSESTESEIEQLAQDSTLLNKHLAERFGHCIDGAGTHEMYIQDLVAEHGDVNFDHLTLVMDCANGAAYRLGPECFSRLGAKVIAINASPSGLNINARAGSEYVRRQPAELGELVRRYNADFGLAFDGDADRVVFIDRESNIIDGDHMLGILATYLDQRQRLVGRTIVATSMRNAGLVDFIKSANFKFIETKVGDKYVMEKLLELTRPGVDPQAVALGGEQAGHILIYDGQHTTGDGIRTALYLIRVYIESGATTLAELAGCVKKAPQVIASAYVASKPDLKSIRELATLETSLESMPGLLKKELRYSGTEPLFRVMIEADARHSEAELADKARTICRAVQEAAQSPNGTIEILNCSRGGQL